MAEFAAAASIAGFVGLAGQVLQGLRFLCDFFDDLHDLPEDVQSLSTELRILRKVVEEIETRDANKYSALEDALKYCKKCTEKLEAIVKSYDTSATKTRTERLWKDMSFAFRSKKLGKYVERLKRARDLLRDASSARDHAVIVKTVSGTQVTTSSIEREVHRVKNEQETLITTTVTSQQLLSDMQSDIRELRAVQSSILANQIKALDSLSSLDPLPHSLQTCFDMVFSKSDPLEPSKRHPTTLLFESISPESSAIHGVREAPDLENAAEALIDNSSLRICRCAPIFKKVLERHVSERMDAIDKRVSNEYSKFGKTSPTSIRLIPRKKWFRSYNFWFGTLLVSTDCAEEYESEKLSIPLVSYKTVTRLTFLPRPWLFWRGLCLAVRESWFEHRAKPETGYVINPLAIISESHPIACAIRQHDAELVKALVRHHGVSPLSQLSNGTTLLSLCIQTMTSHLNGRSMFSREDQDLAIWLLDQGVDPDIQDLNGFTSTQYFLRQKVPLFGENPLSHDQMKHLASLGFRLLENSDTGVDYTHLAPDMLFQCMVLHFYSRREWHPVFTSFLDTPGPSCDGRQHVASFLNFLAHYKWTLLPDQADLEFKSSTLRRILGHLDGNHDSISSIIVGTFLERLERIHDRTYLPEANRSAIIRDICSMLSYHPPLAGSWEIAAFAKNAQLLDLWTEAIRCSSIALEETSHAFKAFHNDRHYYTPLSTFRLINVQLSLERFPSSDVLSLVFFADASSEKQHVKGNKANLPPIDTDKVTNTSDAENSPQNSSQIETSYWDCRIYPLLRDDQTIKCLTVEDNEIRIKGLSDEDMQIELFIELSDPELSIMERSAAEPNSISEEPPQGAFKVSERNSQYNLSKGARFIVDLISSIV